MKKPTTDSAVGFVEILIRSVTTNAGRRPYYQDHYNRQICRNQIHAHPCSPITGLGQATIAHGIDTQW